MQTTGKEISITVACASGVLALAALAVTVDVKQSILVTVGFCGLSVVLLRPFLGLLLYTFLSQVGGLVSAAAGGAGDYLLEGLLAATLLGAVLQSPLKSRSYRWGNNPPALRMAALLVLTGVVSTQFAEFRSEATMNLLQLVGLFLSFFLIVALVRTRQQALTLLLALSASAALSGAIAGLEYAGIADILGSANPGGRNNGAASMSNTTAGNMFLIGTLAASIIALRLPRWRKFATAAALFGAGGVVLTMARSAILMLGVAGCWFGIKVRKMRYFPLVLVLVVAGGVASVPAIPDKVWERFSELEDPDSDWTLGRRVGYHIVGLELLREHPIVGIGPGTFGEHYVGFEFRWVEGRRLETRALHNTYLAVAVEYGVVGFVFFAAMILCVLYSLHRTRKKARDPTVAHLAEAAQFGLVIFLISIASLPALGNKILWIILGLATAIAALESDNPKRSQLTGEVQPTD